MLNLLRKDMKLCFACKKIWILLIGVLIVFVISTLSHVNEVSEENSYVTIGVCDLDDSEYSRLLLTYINESELFTKFATVTVGNQQKLESLFNKGDLDMYLVIPDHFAENLICIENTPIEVVLGTKEKTKALILKDLLTAYGQYITAVELHCITLYDAMLQAGMPEQLCESENVAISYELLFTVLGKSDMFLIQEETCLKSVPFTTYYGYQILFFGLAFIAMLAGTDLLKERRQQIMARLITTQTKKGQIIGAKFISNAMVVFIFLLMIHLCMIGSNAVVRWNVFFFEFLSFLAMTAFFLCLSTFFSTTPGYLLVSDTIILFSAVLGGGILPARYLPEPFSTIAAWTPNGYFLNQILLLHLGNDKMQISSLLLLLAAILVLLLVTCRMCQNLQERGSEHV